MADQTKTKALAEPSKLEVARSESGRDITLGYVDKLLQPEDAILLARGGGDVKIYQELLRDEQVLSTWQQRRQALVSKETYVEPGGTSAIDKAAAKAFEENLEHLNWDDILDKMMYGIFYGYGVSELMWASDGRQLFLDDIKVRKARRFRFGLDGALYLLTNNEPTGILMQSDFRNTVAKGRRNPYGPKFWTFNSGADNSDQPYGLGLGHQLYWPVFFKRNDIKFWLIFLEKFGSPTATAHLPAVLMDDEKQKNKVLQALRALSTDSAVVFPEGAEVALLEAARSGTADYATLHGRMDAAISKVVLSQTMTTDNGSSRSQAEVHKDVRDEVVQGDADLLCGSFNRTVMRWWTELNFAGARPPKVYRKTEEDEDINERADRDQKIKALGFSPTQEYLQEVYGEEYAKWEKNEAPDLLPGKPDGQNLSPNFAEAAGKLFDQRIRNRQDQAAFVEASKKLATQYRDILGDRVDQLITLAEESADLQIFRRELDNLLKESPSQTALEKLKNGGFVSRMMGVFRGQR